jgi:YD repeat-containing protein
MRSFPSCWNLTLSKLGFRRKRVSKHSHRRFGRRPQLESLEARQLLALTVTTLEDVQDTSDGFVSLREAVASGGSIDFHPSLAGGTIRLNSTLSINSAVTIAGPGADKLTISGGGATQVIRIASTTSQFAVGISGVTISDGYVENYSGDGNGGGGIYSTEDLTLDSVVLANNQGGPRGGGLSQKGGSLNVVNSTFSNNKARYGGGAIIDSTTAASITGSSFVHNLAYDTLGDANDGSGAGLYLVAIAQANQAQIKNTTISSNVAERAVGGLILAGSYATMINSTVTLNETVIEYGGLALYGGGLTLQNSIVAGNIGAPDASVAGLSGGNNLFANFTGPDSLGAKLLQGESAQLSPLGNHGGSTPTHVPLPGSRAVDAGSDAAVGGLATDQRGFRRMTNRPGGTTQVVDIGAAELSEEWLITNPQPGGADFNGDGRSDQLLLDPVTHTLSLLASSTAIGGIEPQWWGNVPSNVGSAGTTFTAGDFDGDGRDDLVIRVGPTYHVAISDGNSFVVHENVGPAGAGYWQDYDLHAGDVDGDGVDEILAWNTNAASGFPVGWEVARFSPQTQRLRRDGTWNVGSLFRESGATRFLADANRDGRADLIRRTSDASGGQWGVALSQPLTASAASGALVHQAGWSTTWFDSYYVNGVLDADGTIQKIIDVFESVYNTVELELYPGLMKGPDATEQTKAGNDWDQAALLERELTAIGVPAWIVTGTVSVPAAEVAKWLGVLNPDPFAAAIAATNILRATIDAQADFTGLITFQHAWVRAQVPRAGGVEVIDLDPSWKFKDRQDGIAISESFNFVDVNGSLPQPVTGVFDEFEYLTLNPSTDKRLPLEFYEDQLKDYLTANYPGTSLADVAYDGPILTKSFPTIPAGVAGGASSTDSRQFDSLSTLLAAGIDLDGTTPREKYTHRVKISLLKGADAHWSDELVVPSHSLDSINITFASSFAGATNPDSIAVFGSSQFFGRLTVGGTVRQTPVNSSKFFGSSDTAVLEVTHYSPRKLSLPTPSGTSNPAGPSANDRKLTFNEKPGEIIAFAMDANQHSEHSLVDLKADILAGVANHTTEATLLQDVDDLTAYAGAKYWYDFNRSNEAVVRGTRSIGGQQWVGSGIVKADPVLLADPVPEGSNDVLIEFLPYGMAPQNFGVDLPNSNHFVGRLDTGLLNQEAWQLLGYNSSALEHTIVEEVISSPSISTIKGLQRAAQTNLGFTGSGALDTGDSILVFESVRNPGTNPGTWTNTWTTNYSYLMRVVDGLPRSNGTGAGPITSEPQLTHSTTGLLREHNSTTNLGHTIWQFFDGLPTNPSVKDNWDVNKVTVLVPSRRTNLYDGPASGASTYIADDKSWVGGVYIADIPGVSSSYIITNGQPTSGGFSGNNATAPPVQLKPATFPNFTSAGDPVNVGNGNMYRDETDIVYPNLGVPLTFSRHYDAQSKDDFGMGAGWMHSFGDLMYTEGNDRVWLDSGGQRHVFKWNGASFTVPDSLRGDLAYTAGAAAGAVDFVFKSRDGMEYRFEKVSLTQSGKSVVGRLNSIVDRNNDGIVVEYQAGTSHRTIKHVRDTHSTGVTPDRRLAFEYDNGVIDSISKHAGGLQGTWDFSYIEISVAGFPSTKRLSASLAPAVANLDASYTQTTSRPTVSYFYVGPSDPYLGRGLIQQITEPDGAWHGYEYYANGRVFRVRQGNPGEPVSTPNPEVQSFTYNLYRNLTEFTDERGNIETYIHQDNGQLKTQIHPDRTRLSYAWGAMGTPEEFRLASTTDERGAVESFTYYSASDSVAGATNPAFRRGQLKTSTTKRFPAAAAITTAYDYFNPANKPHIAALASVIVDSTAAVDDAPNNVQYAGKQLVTTYGYDADGRRTLTTDPLGNQVVETYYDTSDYRHGLLKSVIDARRHAGADWEDGDHSAVAWRILGNRDVAVEGGSLVIETPLTGHDGYVSLDALRIDRIDGSGNVVETHIVDDDVAGQSAGFSLVGVIGAVDQTDNLQTPRYAGDAISVPYTGQSTGSLARWEFKDLKAGTYRISTTWIDWNNTPGRSGNVQYQVVGGGAPFAVDQKLAPDTGTFGVHWFDEFETTFEYDAAGNVTKTKTSDGYSSGLRTYNAFGQVVHGADATGVFTEAVYDALGRLRETGYGDSNATTINPLDQFTSTFKYDAVGRVRESVDPLGRVTKFEYDGRGRLVKQINADATFATHEYDDLGNCISRTDELGRTTRFVYDVRNRLVQTIHPDGAIERTRYDGTGNVIASFEAVHEVTPTSPGAVTTFKYDAVGRLTESKLPDPVTGTTTASSPTTTNKYDKLGHLVETVDPEANVTQFKYDKLGRVIQSQTLAAVNGSRTLTSFATVGTLLSLTTTDYDANGNVRRSAMFDTSQYDATETDALEANPRAEINAANVAANLVHITSTAYDAFNRVREAVNADGTSVRLVYDAAGRTRRTIDELGRITTQTYDALGRLASTTLPDPDGADPTLSSPVTRYSYDVAGNQTAITDARGYVTHFQYDASDRLAATIDALGGWSTTTFNAVGQAVIVTNALGHAAFTRYDKRGRAVLTRAVDPDGAGHNLAPTTRRTYDAAGRLDTEIDPRGTMTEFEYDKIGRLRFERTTLSEIVDDEGDDADPSFQKHHVNDVVSAPPTGSEIGYGGDWRLITTNGGYAAGVWTFENLPAGTYRIATTWTPNQSYNDYMSLQVTVDGGLQYYPAGGPESLNQRTAPNSIVRYDEGFARGWKLQSQNAVNISDPDVDADGCPRSNSIRCG